MSHMPSAMKAQPILVATTPGNSVFRPAEMKRSPFLPSKAQSLCGNRSRRPSLPRGFRQRLPWRVGHHPVCEIIKVRATPYVGKGRDLIGHEVRTGKVGERIRSPASYLPSRRATAPSSIRADHGGARRQRARDKFPSPYPMSRIRKPSTDPTVASSASRCDTAPRSLATDVMVRFWSCEFSINHGSPSLKGSSLPGGTLCSAMASCMATAT